MSQTPTNSVPSAEVRLAALEGLDDPVVCVDADLRITCWNAAAANLLDRSSADVLTKAIMQVVAPESRLEMGRVFERALRGEKTPRHETILLRRDGEGIPMSIAIGPMRDDAGKVNGLVLLGRDIVALQRLQLQLLQSKRMESAGHLAGGVAHEFNNILTAIIALTDLSARDLPATSSARADLTEIREQATKGANLVRHLIAFSRRQLLRTEVVRLGSIVQELEPLLQQVVGEQILLASDVTEDSHMVEIDRAQLELVLLELVANAAESMEAGGTMTVTVRSVTIGPAAATERIKPGEYVQFTIQDTGSGIGPDVKDRLLEPFVTTKGDGHVGLGLSMVDGVIRQHGGSVSIDSSPETGTIVRILLPAVRATPVVKPQAAPVAGEQGGSETILVVEDETAVRNIICRSLRARGFNVLEAKNGEDALLVAEKYGAPIHLVLTDVVMPEMGGAELFHHLRRWYPSMRTLFISGYTRGAIPEEALEEGSGVGFLPKPFTLDQLATEVRRMIEMPRNRVA